MQSFNQYFFENREDEREIINLLDAIDAAVDRVQDKVDQQEFEKPFIDILVTRISRLTDSLMAKNERLPDSLQGDAGERPRHLATIDKLKSLPFPESVMIAINKLESIL